MQQYHTTRQRAFDTIKREGFIWQESAHPQAYDGSYNHADGRRAYIDEARRMSYDRAGKHWFAIIIRN
jgi:hypothetical protein